MASSLVAKTRYESCEFCDQGQWAVLYDILSEAKLSKKSLNEAPPYAFRMVIESNKDQVTRDQVLEVDADLRQWLYDNYNYNTGKGKHRDTMC